MITETKDYYILYRISRLVDAGIFEGIDFTAQTFFSYLINRADKDKIKVFVNVENKEINGFAICSLSEDVVTQRPEVFIDLAWVKKGVDGKVGKDLLEKIEDYAKSLNLNRISGFTLRGQEDAMFRKYGFRRYSTIMVKDLIRNPHEPQKVKEEIRTEPQNNNTSKDPVSMNKHKEVCRAYYKKHRKELLKKRRERYLMKKIMSKKYEQSRNTGSG